MLPQFDRLGTHEEGIPEPNAMIVPAADDAPVLVNNQGPHRTVVIAQRYYSDSSRARIPDPDPAVVGASDHVSIWCKRNSVHPARMTVDFGDQCPVGPPAGPLRD
jgi:hypothetical protein